MFSTTAEIHHSSPIPAGISASKGVALLHDHEFFIQCDPHMTKYSLLTTSSNPAPTVPESRQVVAIAEPKCYSVTDRVHALPAGLWDSDIDSTYEFIDFDKGVFVRIRSPLSVVLETLWTIKETEDGSCELVEDILISCSRLFIGPVKSTCEGGWKKIHDKMIGKLKEGSSA